MLSPIMLARVQSYLLQGIDALPCEVEVDFEEGGIDKQRATVVGLPDSAVKESIERVRSALGNSGYYFPLGRILVNLAPADVRKEGPLYDLPIALGLLMNIGVIRTIAARKPPSGSGGSTATLTAPQGLDLRKLVIAGELALDGRLRPVRGAIAMAALARQRGAEGVILPAENAAEAAVVEGVNCYPARTLVEVVGLLTGQLEPTPYPPVDVAGLLESATVPIDFADVRGQEAVKRAITVAAAGMHNLFRLGPGGRHDGRTALRRSLPRATLVEECSW